MNPHDNAEALLGMLAAPRRNQFFYGKRMDVQHFRMEQDYGKQKQWLLNRLTLGKGVVCGLRVSVDGRRICVDPGVAVDGLGREIVVPMRACIDPLAPDQPCCEGREASAPVRPPAAETAAGSQPAEGAEGAEGTEGVKGSKGSKGSKGANTGIFTLWLCYRECNADYQPVLVSDCDSREQCAPGTVVESFCLKVTPGLPPAQGDPRWCAKLWPKEREPDSDDRLRSVLPAPFTAPPATAMIDSEESLRNALRSRRHLLCELFDGDCESPDGDPCVPLSAIALNDGIVAGTESCAVRPRVYSNAALLDMVLCLAQKIDECCKQPVPGPAPAELLHVRSIDFIRLASTGTAEVTVASVASPLKDTPVRIRGRTDAIRIRFSKPLALDAHKPTTHALNDPAFQRHNVQVLPKDVLGKLPYVPGSVTIETPDTVRFDLIIDSPYSRGPDGWQKGRYRIFLRGTADPANKGLPLADGSGAALDGEPIAPVAAVLSGDGSAGGDFTTTFTVG